MDNTITMAGNLDAEVQDVMRRIRKTVYVVKGEKKKKILYTAARPVVNAAKSLTPIGKPRGGILKGAASATYSKGVLKSRYYPLNLRRSLRVLPLKKTSNAVVGPVIKKNDNGKNYGKTTKTVNAYYAQMLFGSSIAFYKRITGAAFQSTQGQVISYIEREIRKHISKEAQKNNLK